MSWPFIIPNDNVVAKAFYGQLDKMITSTRSACETESMLIRIDRLWLYKNSLSDDCLSDAARHFLLVDCWLGQSEFSLRQNKAELLEYMNYQLQSLYIAFETMTSVLRHRETVIGARN